MKIGRAERDIELVGFEFDIIEIVGEPFFAQTSRFLQAVWPSCSRLVMSWGGSGRAREVEIAFPWIERARWKGGGYCLPGLLGIPRSRLSSPTARAWLIGGRF